MENRHRLALVVVLGLFAVVPATAHAQAATPLPTGVTQAMVDQGKVIFGGKGLCYACHGKAGEGLLGPTTKLANHDWIHSKGTYPEIVAYVKSGVTAEQSKSGQMMPPRGGSTITDEEVNQVAAYVYVISRK